MYSGKGGMGMNFLDYKYFRIEGKELADNTMRGKGMFSLCWSLINNDVLEEEDEDLYKEIDKWFAEELPFPEACVNRERVICFFKMEHNESELLKLIKPALWLLDRYKVPYFVILTNDPGEIIYEDKYQIVVKVEDAVIDHYVHTWMGKED